MKKRIGSIFLTLCLLISMFSSINVHAEENIKNVNVNIAVVGMYNEILFKPQQISVNYEGENPTAEDALKATGLTAQIKDNGWIESIENQANGTDDGYYNSQSGWMYKVNFTVPNKLAKEQGIKDEDYVFFYYAKSQSDLLPSYDSTQNDFVNVTVKSTQNDNSFNEQVTVLKNNSVNAAIMEALKKHGSDFDRSSLSSGMLMTGDGHLWSYILNDDKGTYDEQELQLKDGDIITVLKDDGEGIKEDEENSTTTADTEKPVIAAEGLTDGQNVSEAELTFKVTVSDNADKTIVPTVKLNSEVITGTDGTYKVTLIDGDNTITIEAVDAAGNKADATYKIEYTAAPKVSYKTQLDKSLAYILKTVDNPQLGTSGGEWSVLSLARANYTVPGDYYSKYYDNVAQVVKEKSGVLHAKKYTEYSRVILGLTSIGKGVTDVGGYNLLEKLADYDKVIWQGINGPIFALIALDSKNYEIPIVEGISTQTTREKLIENILSKEINKGTENAGGWALGGSAADPDITAMAIQSLTPYYNTNSDVKAAVDRGINILSKLQLTSGGYKSWGSENSESTSQVIVALSELGIDPSKDTRFVKNGNSLIDALLTFGVADGGFKHISSETEPNGMATDQGTYALVAYDRFVNGKNSLYNMTDAQGTDTEKPAITVEGLTNGQTVSEPVLIFKATVSDNVDKAIVPTVKLNGNVITATDGTYKVTLIDGENTITVEVTDAAGNKADVTYKIIYKSVPLEITLPDEDNPEIKIPQDSSEAKDCKISIKASDSNKEIKIEIPKEKNSKVILGLPANTELPKIDAVKDNITVQIPKGAKITSGDTSSIELITARDKSSENVVNKLISVIPQDKKLDAIEQYFSMGTSSKIVFSNYVTLTFKNMKGKDAAYIQNGTLYAIQKYSNDLEGQNSGKNEYAYESGNDLIVKTKHFTEFIAYTTSNKDNGGNVTPSKSYVTLSVDKQTINKGYVINPTSVELQPGDTAWTVLKRELDKRGLNCSYEFTEKYGSIYVQSIDGDGEFDHGSGSGWMYNVNGWYPNYGSSKYVLKNGDVLQWRYTTNLGADLGEDLSKWQDPSNPNPSNSGTTNPSNSSTTNPSTGEQTGKTAVIDVPKDITKDYEVNINDDLKKSDDIIINVPDVKSKVYLNIDKIKDNTPKLTAAKNNISVTIDKGTKIQSQDNKIELITSMDNTDTKVLEIIAKGIDKDYEFNKIDSAFVIGSRDKSILFSQPVTLVFKNCKGKAAGFIEGDKFIPIKIYESNEKGKAAVKSDEKFSYAYVDENNLIVKTNHFTTYVTYEQTKIYYKDQSTISKDIKKQVIDATEKEFISPRNGRFDGKVYIARADFAKMLVGIFGIDTKTAKQLEYSDMKPGSRYYSYYPYYTYINAVCNAGLMQCVNNNFRPNMGITREEAAAAIAKGLAIKNVTVNAKISDLKNVSKYYKTDVETLCTLGLIPLENNQFKPKSYVTREFAVVFCMRAYEYKNGKIFAKADVKKYIDETAALMQKNTPNPVVASVGGEWTVLSLARSGVLVPESFYSKYLTNLENTLKEKKGKLHNVKYTEYDRVILALTSMGKKVDDVASYNLLIPLADFNTLIKQGLNGPIWALIALDTCNFKIPEDKSVALQTTREKLIDYILERELPGGGWSLTSKAPADTDITAMTLTALSRYQGNTKVKAATDRALAFLSRTQEKDGKYKSTWGDETSSESLAQVIVALTSLNIDPLTDSRFIKNGNDTIKALLTFYVKDGGFKHVLSGSLDAMATDQGMYALIAYSRFANGQGKLFDMTDAEKK